MDEQRQLLMASQVGPTTNEETALLENCQQLLQNSQISIERCIRYMSYIVQFEGDGATQCPDNLTLQRVEHNPKFYTSACGSVEITLLNYFDGSSSVHFLRAKAIFNMIFVSSRLLEVIHAWIDPASSWLEPLFWYTRSYIMTISNISGTMSTWLTLMVTVETVMCVLLPFVFRQYCTKRLTWTYLGISLTLSTMLHLTLIFASQVSVMPIIRLDTTQLEEKCWFVQHMYALSIPDHPYYQIVQKVYYWTQNAVAIVIPTIAMLVCSILIVKQFTFKELGEAFSTRRKCVIRMTVATTVSHLLLEGPATLTHAAAALKGSSTSDHHYLMCILNHGNNLLSVVNATIPFFVFLLCNEQFRHMTAMYIKAYMQTDRVRRKTYLSQAGMRCSRVSRVDNERSFADIRLLPKSVN